MCGSLTLWGYVWGLLSILVAASTSVGYYFAAWLYGDPKLQGKDLSNATLYNPQDLTLSYSTFRRCNHWDMKSDCEHASTDCGVVVKECGRYKDFSGPDGIPSAAWQTGAILGGIACGLLILVALTALFSFFIKGIFNKYVAGICGLLQGLAGLCMAVAVIIYPIGWDADDIKNYACGLDAGRYKLGDCTLGWAFYVSAVSAAVAIFVACLSPAAKKDTESMYSRGYTI